ncbi:Na+/H+ antiporter NhaA [Anaerolineales bacterium]
MFGNSMSPRHQSVERAIDSFRTFINSQVYSSVILLVVALIAMIWANLPIYESYFHLWESELVINIAGSEFGMTLHAWVNDALMVLFFLLVGLEVKEQILIGELSTKRKAILPIGAALGGMLAPATIYLLFNGGKPSEMGWGIPTATDIAFALGLLVMLGKRVPVSLRIFLAALAIADDIGAILIIAVFYTDHMEVAGLFIAALALFLLYMTGRLGIFSAPLLWLLGFVVWFGILISGFHATIAGVLIAFAIPARSLVDPSILRKPVSDADDVLEDLFHEDHELDLRETLRNEEALAVLLNLEDQLDDVLPPITRVEKALSPWVYFIVLPLFALANTGVHFGDDLVSALTSPVSLGIIFGLFFGKQIGISAISFIMVKIGIADLPDGVGWRQLHAVSVLGGIGFTVALFVTDLAFHGNHAMADHAKIAIIIASIISGIVGLYLLSRLFPAETEEKANPTAADEQEDSKIRVLRDAV